MCVCAAVAAQSQCLGGETSLLRRAKALSGVSGMYISIKSKI
jgi:hypothetical protein